MPVSFRTLGPTEPRRTGDQVRRGSRWVTLNVLPTVNAFPSARRRMHLAEVACAEYASKVTSATGVKAWRLQHYIPAAVFDSLTSADPNVVKCAQDVIATFASLVKWRGYANAKDYGLELDGYTLTQPKRTNSVRRKEEEHLLGQATCSLCQLADKRDRVYLCRQCPLYTARDNNACSEAFGSESLSPWDDVTHNGELQPMINWLQYTLDRTIAAWRLACTQSPR